MKPSELIEKIRQTEPALLKKLADPEAARLLRAALGAIREAVDACSEGKLVVKGLGKFLVRQAKKKDAPEGGETKRVVKFLSVKPGEGGKEKGKGKGKGKRKAKGEDEGDKIPA